MAGFGGICSWPVYETGGWGARGGGDRVLIVLKALEVSWASMCIDH